MSQRESQRWEAQYILLEDAAFTCGYCGAYSAAEGRFARLVQSRYGRSYSSEHTYFCSNCHRPTYFGKDHEYRQVPGPMVGNGVRNLPGIVESQYREARLCMRAQAYTATALMCRKLLMNVAVAKGAPDGEKFTFYVKWLSDHGFTTSQQIEWVDRIREKGNEATHVSTQMSEEDAEHLLTFCEMLLKQVFEFPARLGKV